jgi:hypothetical protein
MACANKLITYSINASALGGDSKAQLGLASGISVPSGYKRPSTVVPTHSMSRCPGVRRSSLTRYELPTACLP